MWRGKKVSNLSKNSDALKKDAKKTFVHDILQIHASLF